MGYCYFLLYIFMHLKNLNPKFSLKNRYGPCAFKKQCLTQEDGKGIPIVATHLVLIVSLL